MSPGIQIPQALAFRMPLLCFAVADYMFVAYLVLMDALKEQDCHADGEITSAMPPP